MTKEMLINKIKDIKKMGWKELEEFEKVLSNSYVRGRAKKYLLMAVDARREDLEFRGVEK